VAFLIAGFVTKDRTALEPLLAELPTVSLNQGFYFLPVPTTSQHPHATPQQSTLIGSSFLTDAMLVAPIGIGQTPLGYLEIDCFGGDCSRFAMCWLEGEIVWYCFEED
jgi:hypothetical protein